MLQTLRAAFPPLPSITSSHHHPPHTAAFTRLLILPAMHSYRFRYIFLGFFICCMQSAHCHMCGYEFDDVASKSYLSDIVFEGTFLGKYKTDMEERYNASFKVLKLHKGNLPVRNPSNRYQLVIAGDFGPPDREECVAPLNASGPLIVFLSNPLDPTVPFYRISAFPERATPKAVRAINSAVNCNDTTHSKRCATSPGAKVVAKSKTWSVGRTITLRCKIQGNPPPKVTWIKDNLIIEGDNRRVSIKTNRRSSRLRIKKCTGDDDGIYYCRANNVKGQSTEDSVVVVQGKSKPDAHTKRCTQQTYCLNGGQCFVLETLGTKFCKCGTGFTGRRCQMKEPQIFTDPPIAERRDAQQFDRTMTISCIIIGALVLAAMCIAAYCMAKKKREKFYRKKAERERQKAAANGTYQKVPKEEAPQGPLVVQTLTAAPPTGGPRPVKTMGIQTEPEMFPMLVKQESASLVQRDPDHPGSRSSHHDTNDGARRSSHGHSRSNSMGGGHGTYDGRRNSGERHHNGERRNSDRHGGGSGGERRASRQSDRQGERHSDHHADRHSDHRHGDHRHSHSSERRPSADRYGDHDRHSERHGDRAANGERRNSRQHSDRQGASSNPAEDRHSGQYYEGSPPGSIDRLSQYGGSVSGSDALGGGVQSRSSRPATGVSASAERLDHIPVKRRASNPRLVNAVVETNADRGGDSPTSAKRASPALSARTQSAHTGFDLMPGLSRVRRADSDSGSPRGSRGSSQGSRGEGRGSSSSTKGSKRSLELGEHSDYENQPSDLEVNMESEVDMQALEASGDEVEGGRASRGGKDGDRAVSRLANHNSSNNKGPQPQRAAPGEQGQEDSEETETSDSDSSSSGGGQEAVLFEKLKHNPQMAKSKSGQSRTSAGSLHWDEFGNNSPSNNPSYATQQYAFNPYATDGDVIDNKYAGSKNPGHEPNAYQNHRKSRANHHLQDGLMHMLNDDPDATPV